MAKTIQVHKVPDDRHRILKERAAESGMALSEAEKVAEKPALAEMIERLRKRKRADLVERAAGT